MTLLLAFRTCFAICGTTWFAFLCFLPQNNCQLIIGTKDDEFTSPFSVCLLCMFHRVFLNLIHLKDISSACVRDDTLLHWFWWFTARSNRMVHCEVKSYASKRESIKGRGAAKATLPPMMLSFSWKFPTLALESTAVNRVQKYSQYFKLRQR